MLYFFDRHINTYKTTFHPVHTLEYIDAHNKSCNRTTTNVKVSEYKEDSHSILHALHRF